MSTTEAIPTLLAPPRSTDHAAVWLSEALHEAARLRATDLHFFPAENEARLWLRIDGVLQEAARYPRAIHERLIARLKVMARCPDYVREAITEGRVTLTAPDGGRRELRLSVVPSLNGEKAVVRLFQNGAKALTMGEMGYSATLAGMLSLALERPQGLTLVTGPAGSGKSTALAALLQEINGRSASPLAILTLEDPPEVLLPFATQVPVNAERGLTFASGLVALLRQDPEVLMVGEIRDPETAQVALGAALTGHRLLSSLHTLTPAEALIRLQDMGVAPFVLASAIGGILCQRLVRRPCNACHGWRLSEDDDSGLAMPVGSRVPSVVGCGECQQIGYRGRTAIAQWSLPGPAAVEGLLRRVPASHLEPMLENLRSCHDEAREAVLAGRTTLEEAARMLAAGAPGPAPTGGER